jgi:hypothetical protein
MVDLAQTQATAGQEAIHPMVVQAHSLAAEAVQVSAATATAARVVLATW